MKRKKLLVGLIATFAAYVSSDAPVYGGSDASHTPPKKMQLTALQEKYLDNYCLVRKFVIRSFQLRGIRFGKRIDQITLEDLRPHLAVHFKLDRNASWNDFLKIEGYKKYVTEENRVKFSQILLGHDDGTWKQMLDALEDLRIRRAHEKKSRVQATGRSLFLLPWWVIFALFT
jgi:hypothetical protein